MRNRSKTDHRMRGRYRIIDETTGETLGIYFSDEGYSSFDLPALKELLPQYNRRSLRITGVDWPEYGEVQIFIKGRKIEAEEERGIEWPELFT